MKVIKKLVFMCIGLLTITSCKEDTVEECDNGYPTLRVTVQPVYGSTDLFLDSTYTTSEGYDVQFTDIKFYMENPRNGSSQLTDAALFDYRSTGITLLEEIGAPANYAGLNANLGVHSSVNHDDPAAFPNESMLNIVNANDMHWGWNPGYIFVKIEAKVDTIADGNPLFNHNVVFHIGKDENFQTLSFSNLNWLPEGDNYVLPIKLDMQMFLQNGTETIDLKNEYSSHTSAGQEILSAKVIANFRDALTLF